MTARIGLWTAAALLVVGTATAQVNTQQAPEGYPPGQVQPQIPPQQPGYQPAGPPQSQAPLPVQSPPQPLPPPFVLAPNEQAELNRVLKAWEQSSAQVKTFECDFTRWQYNDAFGGSGTPVQPIVRQGVLKYAAPDKGLFRVDGDRAEQWICDGKSVFEFNYPRKELIEYKLPPQLQGKAIVNGPLPFMFGAQAENLNQRYYLRIRPQSNPTQIMLEAFPRFQPDAANFSRVDLILSIKPKLQPSAIQIYEPSGQSRTVYEFQNPLVNFKNPLQFLQGNPFQARLPAMDWRHVVDEPPAVRQASRQR
jgi:TIGR03009 family protein